ncbi:transporter [Nocardia sp. NPDC004860]|uniref:transporter n=1 Tax=unclassified Nocardia TaxID=2637762 RepID=UPI0033AC3DFE
MDIKNLLLLLADLWMIFAGFTYGSKFIRNFRNYLLGLEWIIVATSGTNFFFFALLGAHRTSPMYHIALFFDAFSRAAGITLILILGLMKVTHRYKPSLPTDIAVFALATVAGLYLSIFADRIGVAGATFYVVVNVITSVFLLYFVRRLWNIDERGQAIGVVLATAAAFVIAATYDFYHIPGDDENHTFFYIGALATWGFQMMMYYYAYRALHRHNERTESDQPVVSRGLSR